jgi:hypothetical protein
MAIFISVMPLIKFLRTSSLNPKPYRFDAPYVPGWDCHGLPIGLNVEKKVGKPGQKVSAKEFRQHCRDYALTQVDRQREAFKRLGVLGDWDNPYPHHVVWARGWQYPYARQDCGQWAFAQRL